MSLQQPHNEILIEIEGAAAVLDIKGDITAFSESPLGEAYCSASAQGAKNLVLKIEKEAYINSGGIAVLIQILAQTRRNDQRVAITGLSEHFKKIFTMVGITKFADVFDSMETALEALQ